MTGINYVPNKVLTEMREQFLNCKKKLKHIQTLYSNECVNSTKLKHSLCKAIEEKHKLLNKAEQLQRKMTQ